MGSHFPSAPAPKLSVIIPTYNRATVLSRCLEAMAAQSCGSEVFEIVVGDDGSPDQTREVATAFAASERVPLTYVHQTNSGANAARNRAIRASRGELILLINDDTIPVPDMVARHLAAHAEYPDDRVAVVGRVTVDPLLPYSPLAKVHLDCAFDAFAGRREHDWRAFFTCNVSLKRSLLDRGGMFEEGIRYHEDLELSERLSHHGLRVIYEPLALGHHDHFLTDEEFYRVAIREARALVGWARKAPHLIPMLAELGFEPRPAFPRNVKLLVADAIFNRVTLPVWKQVARFMAPALEPAALTLYVKIYQALKRAEIRNLLTGAAS